MHLSARTGNRILQDEISPRQVGYDSQSASLFRYPIPTQGAGDTDHYLD